MMTSALQCFTVQFLMGRHMLSCGPFHVHIVHVLSSTKETGPVHLLHLLRQQHCAMFYVACQSPCCCRVAPPTDSVATASCIFCAAKADLKDVSWFAARVCLSLSSHLRTSASVVQRQDLQAGCLLPHGFHAAGMDTQVPCSRWIVPHEYSLTASVASQRQR